MRRVPRAAALVAALLLVARAAAAQDVYVRLRTDDVEPLIAVMRAEIANIDVLNAGNPNVSRPVADKVLRAGEAFRAALARAGWTRGGYDDRFLAMILAKEDGADTREFAAALAVGDTLIARNARIRLDNVAWYARFAPRVDSLVVALRRRHRL